MSDFYRIAREAERYVRTEMTDRTIANIAGRTGRDPAKVIRRRFLRPLGLTSMSFITRITRTTMLEVKRQDYIRTARAKGASEMRVVLRQILGAGAVPAPRVATPLPSRRTEPRPRETGQETAHGALFH